MFIDANYVIIIEGHKKLAYQLANIGCWEFDAENTQITFKDKANEHAKVMIDEHFAFFKKYNDDDFWEALTHMFFNDFKNWMVGQGGEIS